MYIDDFIPTLANCCENFRDGEVVNIGGREYRSVEDLSNIILGVLKKKDSLVHYREVDEHNVTNKRPDISRAVELLDHDPKVTLEEGVAETIRWMRKVYQIYG